MNISNLQTDKTIFLAINSQFKYTLIVQLIEEYILCALVAQSLTSYADPVGQCGEIGLSCSGNQRSRD